MKKLAARLGRLVDEIGALLPAMLLIALMVGGAGRFVVTY